MAQAYSKPPTFRDNVKLDDDKGIYASALYNTTQTNSDITAETKVDLESFVTRIKDLVAQLLKEIEDARLAIKKNNTSMQVLLKNVPQKAEDLRKWAEKK